LAAIASGACLKPGRIGRIRTLPTIRPGSFFVKIWGRFGGGLQKKLQSDRNTKTMFMGHIELKKHIFQQNMTDTDLR
tara:strand:+ start:423 stop:653 length:231 start_codon:yes stop_codon:yes gene_type:complete